LGEMRVSVEYITAETINERESMKWSEFGENGWDSQIDTDESKLRESMKWCEFGENEWDSLIGTDASNLRESMKPRLELAVGECEAE
jgi:hypothetical protein